MHTSHTTFPFNSSEQEAIQQLRNELHDQLPERYCDFRLIKFLKAQKFNIKKTAQMVMEDSVWRKEMKADEILSVYPDSEMARIARDYWPHALHGYDKEGSPIIVERVGTIHAKSAFSFFPKEVFIRNHIFFMERVESMIEQSQKPEEGFILIQDLEGLGIKQLYYPALSVLSETFKIDKKHYPNLVKAAYFVNVPSIFTIFYKVLNPFVDPQTIEKVKIFNSKFLPDLQEIIEMKHIPRYLGGSCDCKLEKCTGGGGSVQDLL